MFKEKDVAKYKCKVVMGNVEKSVIDNIMSKVSPKLKVKKSTISGKDKHAVICAEVEYGPVKGAWESDVRAMIKRAQAKANMSADFMIIEGKREVVKVGSNLHTW
jgi:hypothetical protein